MAALLISLSAVFNMEISYPKIAGLVFGIAAFYAAVEFSRRVDTGVFHLIVLIIAAGGSHALRSRGRR